MKSSKSTSYRFFFCPASDYLNQYNETGSHGQISYQFLKHLASKKTVKKINAVVIMSLIVKTIQKTKIDVLVTKKGNKPPLNPFDSLYFYIASFIKYFRSSEYKSTDIVHHIIPFSFGRSFNLFFIFKNKRKKYVIGPIIGPHTSSIVTADETYVFTKEKNLLEKIRGYLIERFKNIAIKLFGSILFRLSLKTLQNADLVLCSDNHSLQYHKKFLRDGQKIHILDTGVNTDVFKPSRSSSEKNQDNNLLKVLFVGRLTRRKGCEYLIRAIAHAVSIKKDIKINCKILGVGPLYDELSQLVSELNITEYVEFLGGVKSNEDIVHQYHQTDIVCLPALSETFTVTKEAMCSGKPVIVTDVCSNAERVKQGKNGFVVNPMDSESIANIFLKLAGNKKLLNEMSQNAVKERELYDWSNILDKYLSILSNA